MQTTLFPHWLGTYDIHVAYHEVRTKMLLVRWSRSLADLERRLVAELNLRLEALPAEKYCHRFQADRGISAEEPCVWDMSSFSSAVPPARRLRSRLLQGDYRMSEIVSTGGDYESVCRS